MIDPNSVIDIERLIDKKTKVLKGQIRELQTQLIAVKRALNMASVVGRSEQVKCWNCGVMVKKDTEELTTCDVCGSEN